MTEAVVTNRECRTYVQQCLPFRNKGSNTYNHYKGATLWGELRPSGLYVVYSYRLSWPLYVCWRGVWFGNTDKVSLTTTRHASYAHPGCRFVPLTVYRLRQLTLFGQPSSAMLVEAANLGLIPSMTRHVLPPEIWDEIRYQQPFHVSLSSGQSGAVKLLSGSQFRATVWGTNFDSRKELYAVYCYGYNYPVYVCWRGVWFINVSKNDYPLSGPVPLTPALHVLPQTLNTIVNTGRPPSTLVAQMIRTGILPSDVVAELVAEKIGVRP